MSGMLLITEWIADATLVLAFLTVTLFAVNEGIKHNKWRVPVTMMIITAIISISLIFSIRVYVHREVKQVTVNAWEKNTTVKVEPATKDGRDLSEISDFMKKETMHYGECVENFGKCDSALGECVGILKELKAKYPYIVIESPVDGGAE